MDDLCPIQPFDFIRVLSITVVIEWSSIIAIPSLANRYPIADILCLISVDMVFGLLSNICSLHGIDTSRRLTLVYGYTNNPPKKNIYRRNNGQLLKKSQRYGF
jgi:hypothetical protein